MNNLRGVRLPFEYYRHKKSLIRKNNSQNKFRSYLINIGTSNDLSSREATLRVLSAREVFTTVFGMGTGGVLLLSHW